MKNLFALFFFVILAAAAVGCKQQIVDKNTQMLDSVIETTVANRAALEAIDLDKLGNQITVYDGFYDFFRADYDKIDSLKYILHDVDRMANCRKSALKTFNNAVKWKEELEKSEEQLRALKHDYENSLVPLDEFQMHLSTELNESFEVNREFQENVGVSAMCMRTFKELTDKLDSTRVYYLKKQNE